MTLQAAFNKARSLETAQKNAEMYHASIPQQTIPPQIAKLQSSANDEQSTEPACSSGKYSDATNDNCMFCGNKRHPRKFCSAKSVPCFKCSKRGHFSKVCRTISPLDNNGTSSNAAIMRITLNATH